MFAQASESYSGKVIPDVVRWVFHAMCIFSGRCRLSFLSLLAAASFCVAFRLPLRFTEHSETDKHSNICVLKYNVMRCSVQFVMA